MSRHVHVVGAGLAGLAAALKLQRAGLRVTVHEAAAHAGGRCRSYFDRTLQTTIDNGNHLVLSGNRATLDYLDALGARAGLRGPAEAVYPFFDLGTGARWAVSLGRGRLPAWIFDARRRVPGTRARDYLALASLLWARPGRSIGEVVRCDGVLWARLLHPLLLAVLNTDPREGAAVLAARVMRETLLRGGAACRPLVAHGGLGAAFVEPALRALQQGGAEVRLRRRLRAVSLSHAAAGGSGPGGPYVAGLEFDDERIDLGADDALVLAVPAGVAAGLLPGVATPDAYRAIVNLHFGIAPPPGCAPVMGLLNGTAEWLFAFDGRLSVTISGADRLLDVPRETLIETVWAEVAAATGLPATLPPAQVIRERRATFAATPDQEHRRPAARTRWRNLALAGDWTATGLPATIEGAIRSGNTAAGVLLDASTNPSSRQ